MKEGGCLSLILLLRGRDFHCRSVVSNFASYLDVTIGLHLLFLRTLTSVGGYTLSRDIFSWYSNLKAAPRSSFMIESIVCESNLTFKFLRMGCNLEKFSILAAVFSLWWGCFSFVRGLLTFWRTHESLTVGWTWIAVLQTDSRLQSPIQIALLTIKVISYNQHSRSLERWESFPLIKSEGEWDLPHLL